MRRQERPCVSVLEAYSLNQSTCHGPICIIMCVNTSSVHRKGQPSNPKLPINERISASTTTKFDESSRGEKVSIFNSRSLRAPLQEQTPLQEAGRDHAIVWNRSTACQDGYISRGWKLLLSLLTRLSRPPQPFPSPVGLPSHFYPARARNSLPTTRAICR